MIEEFTPKEIKVLRILGLIIGIPSAVLALFVLYRTSVGSGRLIGSLMVWGPLSTISVLSLWFAFRGHIKKSRHLILWGCISAFVIGFIGLIGGYVVPYILGYREQGPLMGPLMTGPLGVMIGAIIGVLIGKKIQSRRSF